MRIRLKDRTTEESVFWSNFIITIIFGIAGIFGPLGTTYSNENKNKLQWKGFKYGIGLNLLLTTGISLLIYSSFFKSLVNILLIALSGVALITVFIVFVVFIYKNRIKICNSHDTIYKLVEKAKKDIVSEISKKDYQLRYFIEYTKIRGLIKEMSDEFKDTLLNKEKMIDYLLSLYNKLESCPRECEFDVIYKKTQNETNVVIKLPDTKQTTLCNMIGIKINQRRFFAFTSSAVEWSHEEIPTRTYINFEENNPEKFLEVISDLHNKEFKNNQSKETAKETDTKQESDIIICEDCGYQIFEEDTKCRWCGKIIKEEAITEKTEKPKTKKETNANITKTKDIIIEKTKISHPQTTNAKRKKKTPQKESIKTTGSLNYVHDDIDKLRKYKELFDEGIITEEEFVAKKKQILGI